MALDFNFAQANDMLDTFDTAFPQGSLLQLRTGSAPGAENSAGGTLLAELELEDATPWDAAASGAKDLSTALAGVGVAAGDAAHFRLKNAGDTLRVEGTVSGSGGGGDIVLDNVSIAIDQAVTITSINFTLA